jgi:two-component system sensor histidine kinase UhpB
VTLVIYRVVQEGVINALRHANPAHVAIEVRGTAQDIKVTVTDDGIGLPPAWAKPGHFGLRGLTDRVTQLGGVFDIGNRGGPTGTQLVATIPLQAAA